MRQETLHFTYMQNLSSTIRKTESIQQGESTESKQIFEDILADLTREDVQSLLQAEDEPHPAQSFERLLPTIDVQKYLYPIGETSTYFSMLFEVWQE